MCGKANYNNKNQNNNGRFFVFHYVELQNFHDC